MQRLTFAATSCTTLHPWVANSRPRGESAGPAATSDLHPGDLIVAVNREPLDGIDALHRLLSRVPPGSELTLQVVRRTQLLDVGLIVREPPS